MAAKPADSPKRGVSIICVTYNSANEISAFRNSLDEQGILFEVFFVDNASSDATVPILKAMAADDPRISVTFNSINVGLAVANNQPTRELTYDYVAIINPDVILHPGTLGRLIKYLETHPDVAVVGPVNVDERGEPHSSFHGAWTLFHLFIWRVLPVAITGRVYRLLRKYGEQDVRFVSGACLVARRADYVTIDGYDPNYFLTVEDACDLCIRLCNLRPELRIRVVPEAKVTHLRSRSAVTVPLIVLWEGARGSVYHFFKHHGLLSGLCATAILLLASTLRLLPALPLAPFILRFRRVAKNHAVVVWRLIARNPIRDAYRNTQGRP